MKKAHDDGEFFTPPSLVQMIVNVIEPGLAPPFNPVVGVIVASTATGAGGATCVGLSAAQSKAPTASTPRK